MSFSSRSSASTARQKRDLAIVRLSVISPSSVRNRVSSTLLAAARASSCIVCVALQIELSIGFGIGFGVENYDVVMACGSVQSYRSFIASELQCFRYSSQSSICMSLGLNPTYGTATTTHKSRPSPIPSCPQSKPSEQDIKPWDCLLNTHLILCSSSSAQQRGILHLKG